MSLPPLHVAAEKGDVSEIRRLLQRGTDVNERGGPPFRLTALMCAAANGHLDAARLLLEKGAGVDLKEEFGGQTALHFAAWKGHVEVAKELLRAGASVDLKKNTGWTALHSAAVDGQVEVAKELLRAGASTDIRDDDNKTALDLANQRNKSAVSSVLRDPQRWRQRRAPAVVSRAEVRSRGTVR